MEQRRTDWLRELRGALLAATIVCAAFTIAIAFRIISGEHLSVSLPADGVMESTAVQGLRPGVVLDGGADAYLLVNTPSPGQRFLATLVSVPRYALITTMVALLWRLVSRANREDPFTIQATSRLRLLGWLLILGGPAAYAITYMARFVLSSTVTIDGTASVSVVGAAAPLGAIGGPAAWLLAGFSFLAIAEIVRRGQALRSDVEGLV